MKLFTEIETKNPIEYLYSWKAPERHWKPKDRSWYVIYAFFFTVLVAFLALINEWMLILAVIAFAFLWFVQGSVEPQITEHIISSVGIKTYNKLYRWGDIKSFWFSRKKDVVNLNLDLLDPEKPEAAFKRRLSLIIEEEDLEKIFSLLFNYIEYGDPEDVGVNIFTDLVYGKHVNIEEFMVKPIEENLEEVIEEVKEKELALKKSRKDRDQ